MSIQKNPLSQMAQMARLFWTLALQKGCLVGNAPDTFLGAAGKPAVKLIDDGVIGRPTSVAAFVGTHGVERHHPNPDFYYQTGGGPFDLGPYYLTAMVFLLGPIVACVWFVQPGL